MNFEVINKNGGKKVAFFSKKVFGGLLDDYDSVFKIATYCNIEAHIFESSYYKFYKFSDYNDHIKIYSDEKMGCYYELIMDYIKRESVEICIFLGSGFPWQKEFLERLNKVSYIACYFADDPEGSELTSKPYVKNFNYAFCGGIFFDKNKRIEEKYIEWGARKSKFIPLGAFPGKYAESIRDFNNRAVDVVYVGGCYFPKVFRMFKLKRYFGDRMKMYGRGWNESGGVLKTFILKSIKFIYGIPIIEELPKNKLVELYQNTKIGFNIHMSYGPSNQRMYELPINGVMQICDCEEGLRELYDIGKEVIAYANIDDAIEKIEHYLKNNEERIAIADRGQKKALKYKTEESFAILISEIFSEIEPVRRIF